MRLESALESLDSSSTFLQSLSFDLPKAFQNTLLLPRISITSIIRDAEPHESALFTTSATKKNKSAILSGENGDNAAAEGGSASNVQEILKDREASIPAILGAIERLSAIYPDTSIAATTASGAAGGEVEEGGHLEILRIRYGKLVDSIAVLERDVEAQRSRLESLSIGRDQYGDSNYQNTETGNGAVRDGAQVVTEDMILADEEEVRKLEQLIEAKTRAGR